MILEWRTYRFAPGRATAYLSAFQSERLPLVTRHLPLLKIARTSNWPMPGSGEEIASRPPMCLESARTGPKLRAPTGTKA